MVERAQIIVKGVVQGVGFRPYVYTLAEHLGLKGYVSNTADGVIIEAEGDALPEFIRRLPKEAPPLSQISSVSVTSLPHFGYTDFTIQKSIDQTGSLPFTLVSPDVSICDDCARELLDPADRRYLYSFINCTNCGPRYSITRHVPYDRPNTTMADFTMCPECLREYDNPRDRRFHAQPNACPKCGPEVEFRVRSEECGVKGSEAMQEAIRLLRNGDILAVKGLGGFHIACDASNDAAVKRLRVNKRKSNKPFAVMVPSVEAAERFCAVADAEKNLLTSNKRPVVLLQKTTNHLSGAVSPNNKYVGCMLPYTPLHYLLFFHPLHENEKGKDPHFFALVMTSGNLSEEPIVRDNDEAIDKLSGIVDGFLLHNRDIFMRLDDSVVRLTGDEGRGTRDERGKRQGMIRTNHDISSSLVPVNSSLSFIRRSRGYAPDPIALHNEGPEVLGCGADLKNTFTVTKGKFAIPSQHIGDMENYETVKFFEESLANIKTVYRVNPVAIAHDLHPGYLSTRWAMDRGARVQGQGSGQGVRTYAIQHHYAHIGSVMAEHGLNRKVIGVAFDGTGYGTDGNLWGGEFLIADIDGFERAGQFKYIPLPGGEAAIREPWKTAASYVLEATGNEAPEYLEKTGFQQRYGKASIEQLIKVARSRELSPLSSGAGRLFDAVSALLGLCSVNTFEGEAAMALESHVVGHVDGQYPVEFTKENGYTVVDFSRTITGIIQDRIKGQDAKFIATKFHNTVASVIKTVVAALSAEQGIMDVALSGGTFQNLYLLNRTERLLRAHGMNVFVNHKMPSNDGGISLGQAYIVRERLRRGLA
jgi:hydrogenase maturation protein HypF